MYRTEHGSGTQVATFVRKVARSQLDADARQVPPLRGIHTGKGKPNLTLYISAALD